ncbi:alpha/beta hydrolase family protein [Actinoplanes sp. NPDC049599]|uniref:alpha/beta hydrolase family protein n=1 Tax=Actinoplanes sp. NPDC049599 TaxID=3363903 RepID=UPI0037AF51C6
MIPGLHLSVRELLVVLGSVVLVLGRWLPSAVRRRIAVGAVSVVAVGVALTAVGVRWQLLLVLAADLLVGVGAGMAWLLRRRGDRDGWWARWWLALPGSLTCLALVVAGGIAAWALPTPVFPRPSGASAVGTTVVQWTDPGRAETATPDPGDPRTVVVQLWYPARSVARGVARAQYLGRTRREADTVAAAAADYLGAPSFLLDGPPRATSHAAFDAAPAAGRFPVVLFSPGLGGVRTQNTAWAEDLASRGYLVAGVDHPYDSAAVVLADGRTVRTRIAASGDPDEDDRRRAGWIAVRAADLSFVLTQLGRLDRGELTGPFTGRLDTVRAAATGHSLGGAAAMRAAQQDSRFTAVINLDGGPDSGQGPLRQPVLALTHTIQDQADTDYIAVLSKVLERGTATSYRLTVPGSAHLTFTDASLYLPPVPAVAGSLGRTESVRMTTVTCAAFLDVTLRGRSVDLPTTLSRHGDLRVHPAATGQR